MGNSPWTIEWTDALSVSNPEIDAEHQHFIKLVNELNGEIGTRRDKSEIQRIMGLILETPSHTSRMRSGFLSKKLPRFTGSHSNPFGTHQ